MAYTQKRQHAPIDPQTILPANVRSASARAEQILKDTNDAAKAAAEAAQAAEKDPNRQVVLFTEAPIPAKTPRFVVADNPIPVPATPDLTQNRVENPVKTPEITPPASTADADWKREKEGLVGRLRQSMGLVTQQNARLAELEAMVATASQSVRVTPIEKPLITQEERDSFGEELLDVVGRTARAELTGVANELAQARADLAALKASFGQVAERQHVATTQSMHAQMTALVPDWQIQNNDKGFIDWLALPERFSRVTRQDMLLAEWNAGNAAGAAEFFKAYKNEMATSVPQVRQAQPHKVPLENFAAPGRANADAVATPSAKLPIKRSTIAQFYSAVRAGKFRDDPASKAKFEEEIFDAQLDGRVVEG